MRVATKVMLGALLGGGFGYLLFFVIVPWLVQVLQ